MRETEAIKAMAIATAIWPQRQLGREAMQAYVEVIQDLPFEAVAAGIERLRMELDWMPSNRQLRTAAVEAMEGQKVPDADQAWAEVNRAFRSVGMYRTPEWSHPAIGVAVNTIGWKELCLSENLEVSRAQFRGFYGDGSKRAQLDAVMTPKGRELMEGLGRSIGRELPA